MGIIHGQLLSGKWCIFPKILEYNVFLILFDFLPMNAPSHTVTFLLLLLSSFLFIYFSLLLMWRKNSKSSAFPLFLRSGISIQQKPAVHSFSQETYPNLLTLHWAHVRRPERDKYEKYSWMRSNSRRQNSKYVIGTCICKHKGRGNCKVGDCAVLESCSANIFEVLFEEWGAMEQRRVGSSQGQDRRALGARLRGLGFERAGAGQSLN